ncbi:MAG TPA: hypothetical protein VGJ33_01605 [Candidatus Angelobacter sp.]
MATTPILAAAQGAPISQSPSAYSQPSTIPQAANALPAVSPSAAVDYAHGQLTVVSQNATLDTVLKLVAAKTGAVIDLSPELQNEPVIAKLGPSSVREVLTGLLDSPRIDYIIMGTGENPGSLKRIVVRTRKTFGKLAIAPVRSQAPPTPTEAQTEENDHPAAGASQAEAKLTQEQLMENWKKVREEKRLAEIEQQRQEREDPSTQPEVQPQSQSQPETTQQDNPPQE